MNLSFLKTPESEIRHRIGTIRQYMLHQNMEAVFVTHRSDIFYFSGTAQNGYLMIFLNQDPILFIKQYLPRAIQETSVKTVEKISSVKDIPGKIKELHGRLPQKCGLAFDVVPHRDFLFYSHLFDGVDFSDATPVIENCKQIKSDWEIEQLDQTAELSRKTFEYIEHNIRPGISEMEFCGMFETFARKHGHPGQMLMRHYREEGFPFHLMSGENGGLPGALDSPVCGTGTSNAYPYGAGPRLMKKNEPILIDFGTALNGYHLDESRMFCMGKMEPQAMDASLAAIEILYHLLDHMTPGAVMGDLFEMSVKYAARLGYEETFLGLPELKAKFIGHGTGLELVEKPVLARGKKEELKPGMVLAVEPKFIFKNRFAAGVESVIHVTSTGARFLSTIEHKVFIC